MTLYRNRYETSDDNCGGFSWHKSKRDAVRAMKGKHPPYQDTEYIAQQLTLKTGKDGLLEFLNRYASHPDNG